MAKACKYDGAEIEVINWASYNPRTDAKRPTWFRFDNDLATGSAFFGLNCEHKWMWVMVLSLTSQKNGRPIVWRSDYVESLTGVNGKTQEQALEMFEKFARLRVSRKVTIPDMSTQPRYEQDEQDEQDEQESVVPKLHWLAESWNRRSGNLPKVKECSDGRMRHIRSRIADHPEEAYWHEVIDRIKRSAFCNGKNDRGWRADFDWLLKPDTGAKVSEGKYDDRGTLAAADHQAELERKARRDQMAREAGLESA